MKLLGDLKWDGSFKSIEDIFTQVFPKYNFRMTSSWEFTETSRVRTLALYADSYVLVSTNYFTILRDKVDKDLHMNDFISYLLEILGSSKYKGMPLCEALSKGEFAGWK